MFILITFGFTVLFYHFSTTIEEKPAEEEVEIKYSKKGLFLYPRYKIHVTNSETPSTVTKEQFESIQPGDTINGYMKDADSFITDKDFRFEKSLGIPILVFLYLTVLGLAGGLLKSTKLFQKNAKRQKIIDKILKGVLKTLLGLYIITGVVFTGIMAVNFFHSINSWNQTEVTATVVDGEEERNIIPYRATTYHTYEFFLMYQDKEGEKHITNKDVSNARYDKYESEETLPLSYRNNNVHDTFIANKDIGEFLTPFFRIESMLLVFYFATIVVIIRNWRKKKRKREKNRTENKENIL